MLEVARILISNKSFKPDNTIIFVAFDSEEEGAVGSQEFINKLIAPFYTKRGIKIQGAIILDTILNYNSKSGSQNVPDVWKEVASEASKNIIENGQKGDFLALFSRNNREENKIMQMINKWSKISDLKTEDFVLKKLPAYKEPSIEMLQEHAYFWSSDHARFWFYKENSYHTSIPSVLLTDTGKLRFFRGCSLFLLLLYIVWRVQ